MKNSPADFEAELAELINKHSMEANSNTPDFILARYLCNCLLAWTIATNKRDDMRERDKQSDSPPDSAVTSAVE